MTVYNIRHSDIEIRRCTILPILNQIQELCWRRTHFDFAYTTTNMIAHYRAKFVLVSNYEMYVDASYLTFIPHFSHTSLTSHHQSLQSTRISSTVPIFLASTASSRVLVRPSEKKTPNSLALTMDTTIHIGRSTRVYIDLYSQDHHNWRCPAQADSRLPPPYNSTLSHPGVPRAR